MANDFIQLGNMNYDDIRNNIKSYMSSKSDIDFDFDGTELITTVKLIVTPTTGSNVQSQVFAYRDIDGDGGAAPVVDTIRLSANQSYTVNVLVLDETKNPVDTTSNEIESERYVHEFFYTKIGTYDLTTTYLDFDDHNVPVGLKMRFDVGNAFTAKNNALQVVLKHQPNLKPTTGNGDSTLGETDAEVTFPILVK